MINLINVKRFCKEYWKIANYQEAVNDNAQTWHCHHRYEIEYDLSKIELQAMGFYFNRPFCELIFLTSEEHIGLHKKGKTMSEESRQKISNALKGENNPNYGVHKFGENAPNYKYHITEEELYDLYVSQGLTQKQIAKIYGCGQVCIHRKLKKFNIKQ